MTGRRFDAFAKMLVVDTTRRRLLRGLGGLTVAAPAILASRQMGSAAPDPADVCERRCRSKCSQRCKKPGAPHECGDQCERRCHARCGKS